MKGLIDTNIFIYASTGSDPRHECAKSFLKQCLGGPSYFALTWINIGEFLSFSTQSFSGLPPLFSITEALNNMNLALSSPFLKIITEGEDYWHHFQNIMMEAGNVKGSFVHDCRIAGIMKENGIDTIFTYDTDFRKLPHLKVIQP